MPTLNLTWYQLERLGVALCNDIDCGHPPSAHFNRKGACAHCRCRRLNRAICLPPRSPRGTRKGGTP